MHMHTKSNQKHGGELPNLEARIEFNSHEVFSTPIIQ